MHATLSGLGADRTVRKYKGTPDLYTLRFTLYTLQHNCGNSYNTKNQKNTSTVIQLRWASCEMSRRVKVWSFVQRVYGILYCNGNLENAVPVPPKVVDGRPQLSLVSGCLDNWITGHLVIQRPD